MNLALFDFDGTISNRDSFLLFLKYIGRLHFYRSCFILLPRIFLFLSKRYANQELKEDFLSRMIKGRAEYDLQRLGETFCMAKIPAIIRPGALEKIRWHRRRGDLVCIVTATPRHILEPWCRAHDLLILGTELENDRFGRLTGRLEGANCRGEEKVRRIKAAFRLDDYGTIHCYGDSCSDLPMLGLAPEQNRFFKPFRARETAGNRHC